MDLSVLSRLLVRTTLKWKGLSSLPSPLKQQALNKGKKALTTRDRSTVSRCTSDQMVHIWPGGQSWCSKHVYFMYMYQTLLAPSSCFTYTNMNQLHTSVYDNKLKHNITSDYIQRFLSKQKYSELGKKSTSKHVFFLINISARVVPNCDLK